CCFSFSSNKFHSILPSFPTRRSSNLFRNVNTKQKEFIRGYGYQGGGSRDGLSAAASRAGIGVDFKNSLKMPGPWRMGMGGFGERSEEHTSELQSLAYLVYRLLPQKKT